MHQAIPSKDMAYIQERIIEVCSFIKKEPRGLIVAGNWGIGSLTKFAAVVVPSAMDAAAGVYACVSPWVDTVSYRKAFSTPTV